MDMECRSDEFKVFERVFRSLYHPLCAYARRFVPGQGRAEDVVQDVFFDVWCRREHVRIADGTMKSYLFKAVYTRSLNEMERGHQNESVDLEEHEADILEGYAFGKMEDSESDLLLKELEAEISGYVDALPPQCHRVFVMIRSQGAKNREIAEAMGISVKAVEKHICRALNGLHLHLMQKGLL